MTIAITRKRSAGVLALLILIASGLAAAQTQQVYRYVDPEGRVVYSDKPPPPNARDAQAKRIGKNTIETSNLSFSSVLAQERYPVTLYTFGCGTVCDTASALLNKRGVPHTVVDVGQSDGADKLKRLTGGLDAPALQVGDLQSQRHLAQRSLACGAFKGRFIDPVSQRTECKTRQESDQMHAHLGHTDRASSQTDRHRNNCRNRNSNYADRDRVDDKRNEPNPKPGVKLDVYWYGPCRMWLAKRNLRRSLRPR